MPVSPEVPLPAEDSPDERAHRRELARGVRNALQGKTINTGTVTLTASSTTTTLTDARIGAASILLLMPTTSNAAGALGGLYVSARTRGSATLTHASTVAVDKTFGFVVIG
jgi:hypothetical protein